MLRAGLQALYLFSLGLYLIAKRHVGIANAKAISARSKSHAKRLAHLVNQLGILHADI